MSKERFFKGTFLLTSAGLISRIMGFFYRIFLSHTIGAEGIGLYQLVVPLQHLVLAMTTFGLSLIHISEPTRRTIPSRMPSSA